MVILVTIDGHESAQKMARTLLAERKAACVNIKTRTALVEEVTSRVKANHPYDVPEVIALPIVGGSPDYLALTDSQTTPDMTRQEPIREVDKPPTGE